MPAKKPLTVDTLWQIRRLGAPSLAPDGAQAVAALTTYSMDDNKGRSALWLLSTLGGKPRALTACGEKDGQPRWSPRGDRIAFVAQREQEGAKDETPQLYLIAPDGGEAVRAATVATGVEGFRWCPDGKRLLLVSWVWPELKGLKAQAKQHKAFKERKETGYATSEAQYRYWDHNLPMGREPHLMLLDADSGKVRDLFEGTPYALGRADPGAGSFDVSPDGKRVVFAFDPAPEKRLDHPFALAEMELKSGRVRVIAQDAAWDMGAPRYAPDGDRIAFVAQHRGLKHTMPDQLAVWDRETGGWDVLSAEWDHEVQAPLHWEDDGQAVLFAAEQRGRRHLWRFDLPDRRAELLAEGGWLQAFDKAAGTLVTLADAIDHPPEMRVHPPGGAPRRIEAFNDALMAGVATGVTEEAWVTGALGDQVQVWITYPPGFDPARPGKQKLPLLQVIHGGPHTAFGDAWHFRWNVQAFAAQGYVVAAVNYHGSSSFGYAFKDSITHRWGELELQDVEATTEMLLQRPWADPKRVFATGGSYGGFMVAWMNGRCEPGRYAAYVCHAGCFDWTAMFADDAYTWHAKELGAWYWDDIGKVQSQSPHAFAANMTTPTLVIHGALDYRVPDAQGLAYYNTLKARNVDARLLWFPDENHWILKPRNSRLWYSEYFDWLKRHDAAKPPRRASKARRSR
ncbi:S9 family peptidase [Rubrivivax albus]|uniref:S9 family peptidase n=1 Tax=Rubrivivax albus TaxID=2499835 RepID=A0A437K0L5_9BURK|nr:S9 family peptidase [Rubrivivax albus]RVT53831.1 S9 family peptidase [Rubrivivax albus]